MTHEQELDGYILQGMADAIWRHAFIQWATNVDPPPRLHGKTWAEATPPTDPSAMKAAKEFAEGIGKINDLGAHPMAQMFLATRRYAQPRRSSTRATEGDQAFQFGEEVAQACLGTLDVPELGQYKLPEMRAELDDDASHLSWDEGRTWHRGTPARNPSGEALWAVLVHGQRHWEAGGTSREALANARARHGQYARLETAPNGAPIRSGECPASPKRTRATAAKTVRTTSIAVVPMSIEEFARVIKQDIVPAISGSVGPNRRIQGRVGHKVFISAAYRKAQHDPRFHGMTLQQFKEQLDTASREGLVSLARADLVGAMEIADVTESEYKPDKWREVHFIEDDIGEPYYPPRD